MFPGNQQKKVLPPIVFNPLRIYTLYESSRLSFEAMLNTDTSPRVLTRLIQMLLGGADSCSRLQWQKTLNVSLPAISQWTTGKNLPRPETLLKIIIEHARQNPDAAACETLTAVQEIGLRRADEISNLLAVQGYSCFSAYIGSAVAARIQKQVGEVLPTLKPLSQIELLGHIQAVLDLPKARLPVPETATWLQHRFNVGEKEVESVSNSFVESVFPSVRHSQMLSTLHRKHSGHVDEFLESVMFLTAWDKEDITVVSGGERLDRKDGPDAATTPEQVIEKIKPKRASVRYRRQSPEPERFLRRVV
jgi:hypothetical protein